MRKYIDVTGRTEDEAVANALAQLGLDRDDVSVEILERAKSGFLGIGASPAKVRVSYGEEEEVVVEEPKKAEVKKEVKKAAAPKAEEKPAKTEEVKEEAPVAAAAPCEGEATDAKAEEIRTFLTGLLSHLESNAVIKIYEAEKGHYKIYLEGDKLGQLIGRRGETLDAIQQLTNYSVNRGSDKRVRIHIDAENYREKREKSLESLAVKVAGKVTRYRRNVTLEPMNAYERHVIHTALQEYPGVTTYSTGTEPNRRVIVAYERSAR